MNLWVRKSTKTMDTTTPINPNDINTNDNTHDLIYVCICV